MKLIKAVLKNFLHLYNTTGLSEITLDRSNSVNNVVLILGSNGSGKSLLLSYITPIPYESHKGRLSGYNNTFIPETIGYKQLILEKHGIIYDIEITYDKNKTNCSFKEIINGKIKELNLNGNVSSYLDLLESKFYFKKNYTTIGYIGDSVKNIVNMTSSERTSHISSWIPYINDFLNAHKNITKKILIKKNEIDLYSREIDKLQSGNIENEIKELQLQLGEYVIKRDSFIKNSSILNSYIKSNSNLNKYQIESKIKENSHIVKDLSNERLEILNFATNIKKIGINKINKGFEKYLEKINLDNIRFIDRLTFISDEINLLRDSIINLSINITDEEFDIFKNTPTIKKELSIELEILKKNINHKLKNNSDWDSESILKLDLTNISNMIMYINRRLENITNSVDLDNINNSYLENKDDKIKKFSDEIDKLKRENIVYTDKIRELERNKINPQLFDIVYKNEKEQVNCQNHNCKLYITIKDMMKPEFKISKYEEIIIKNEHRLMNLSSILEQEIDDKNNIIMCFREIKDIEKELKFNENDISLLPESFKDYLNKDVIFIFKNINEINTLFNELYDMKNTLELFNNRSEALDNVDNKAIIIGNKINEKNENKIKIEKLNKLSLEYDELKNKIKENKEEIDVINNFIFIAKTIFQRIKEFNHKIVSNDLIIEQMKKDLISYTKCEYYKKKVEKIELDLIELNNNMDEINSQLEIKKNNFLNLKYYSEKRDELMFEIDKMKKIENLWSPKKGLPKDAINTFLYNIKEKTNDYLYHMWNKELTVETMKIENGNFEILIRKEKEESSICDAISCSNGERSTLSAAISLAMINEGLPEDGYNILRLDEIDSVLDFEKKGLFIDILLKKIKEINCETCFIITHNVNFNQISADLILLNNYSEGNLDLTNKNILFQTYL